MRVFAYSQVAPGAVLTRLGEVEYSYGLVLREFLPLLAQLGDLTVVDHPGAVDQALESQGGGEALFFSFSPPHLTIPARLCPTVAVFAWEFDTLPTDAWYDDPGQDWRTTLSQCAGAITHSRFTLDVVRRAMPAGYPLAALPAPVWDRMAKLRARSKPLAGCVSHLRIDRAVVVDTHNPTIRTVWPSDEAVASILAARNEAMLEGRAVHPEPPRTARAKLAHHFSAWRNEAFGDVKDGFWGRALQSAETALNSANLPALLRPKTHWLALKGVVFTSVFNPNDGRKNWNDLLTAFCEAFARRSDATLIFKIGHKNFLGPLREMLMTMARLPAFDCRVLIVQGALDEQTYADLVGATHFVVNASHGEGQCLPLMEFMSAGTPAIAPRQTGMQDYIDEEAAFILNTWLDLTAWPHDPRIAYRTLRHQIDWVSLVAAYQGAYEVARNQPERYAVMADAASERLKAHCSQDQVSAALKAFCSSNLKAAG